MNTVKKFFGQKYRDFDNSNEIQQKNLLQTLFTLSFFANHIKFQRLAQVAGFRYGDPDTGDTLNRIHADPDTQFRLSNTTMKKLGKTRTTITVQRS